MTTIIEREGIQQWLMASAIARLSIEVKTGMSHSRGSTLKACQEAWGIKARTKAAALTEMKALYKKTYGHEYGGPGER